MNRDKGIQVISTEHPKFELGKVEPVFVDYVKKDCETTLGMQKAFEELADKLRKMAVVVDMSHVAELRANVMKGSGVGFEFDNGSKIADKPSDHLTVGMDIGKAGGDHSVITLASRTAEGMSVIDYASLVGGQELYPYQKAYLEQIYMQPRQIGKCMRLWEQFKRSLEVQEVVEDLETLQKQAKKLRTRIRKEKNPGFIKTLRQELALIDQKIYDLK